MFPEYNYAYGRFVEDMESDELVKDADWTDPIRVQWMG
jgi:hypothetical protein